MANYAQLAKKLQSAINNQQAGAKIVINTQQWYSQDKKRPVTIYIIRQTFRDKNNRAKSIQLFKTYSQVQMLLFLRDYWYEINGWELPTDNEMWEEVKLRYGQTQEETDFK